VVGAKITKLDLEGLTRFFTQNNIEGFNPRHFKPSAKGELNRNMHMPQDPAVIAIFGSAFESGNTANIDTSHAVRLAGELAVGLKEHKDVVLVTGACPDNSLPTIVAAKLKEIAPSIPIIGISPWGDSGEAAKHNDYGLINRTHDLVLYTDFGDYTMRDGTNCKVAEACVTIRGSTGTHHEIAGMLEEGKVIGLMAGSGGASDAQEGIISASKEDGKNHYIVFRESQPRELVARVIAQLHVDRMLRKGIETSSVDLYTHYSGTRGGVEPAFNVRRFVLREEDRYWRAARDRRYPFVSYHRPDLTHTGQLLLGISREQAAGYLGEVLHRKVVAPPCREGEVGILLFPSSPRVNGQFHEAMLTLTDAFPGRVYYQRIETGRK